jgi:hypothetical protein
LQLISLLLFTDCFGVSFNVTFCRRSHDSAVRRLSFHVRGSSSLATFNRPVRAVSARAQICSPLPARTCPADSAPLLIQYHFLVSSAPHPIRGDLPFTRPPHSASLHAISSHLLHLSGSLLAPVFCCLLSCPSFAIILATAIINYTISTTTTTIIITSATILRSMLSRTCVHLFPSIDLVTHFSSPSSSAIPSIYSKHEYCYKSFNLSLVPIHLPTYFTFDWHSTSHSFVLFRSLAHFLPV